MQRASWIILPAPLPRLPPETLYPACHLVMTLPEPSCLRPTPRTLPAASCTAWGTRWWRDLMPPCGCLGAWACPRGCWETCIGEDSPGEVGCLNDKRSPQGRLRRLSHKSPLWGGAEKSPQVYPQHPKGCWDACTGGLPQGLGCLLGWWYPRGWHSDCHKRVTLGVLGYLPSGG